MASFNSNETIILGGDFNARIGNSPGRVKDDLDVYGAGDKDTEIVPEKNNDISIRDRVSEDKKSNAHGIDFLDFCTSTDLCILNDRMVGDFSGKLTFIGHNGCSTVDFALASREARDKNFLKRFKVEDLNIFSDHRPITVNLEKNELPGEFEEIKLEDLEKRIQMPPYNEIYATNMESDLINEKLTTLREKIDKDLRDGISITEHLAEIEGLMVASMGWKKVDKPKGYEARKNKNTFVRKNICFDIECKKLKNGLNHLCKALNKKPMDGNIRRQFYLTKTKYKKN